MFGACEHNKGLGTIPTNTGLLKGLHTIITNLQWPLDQHGSVWLNTHLANDDSKCFFLI